MSSLPRVSIILPVYNGQKYIQSSINSLLAQTYADFELIVINDGSTDNTEEIIKKIRDPRLKIISRPNKGLVKTLNEGIRRAKGEFIARQDADDLSLPTRLEKQISFLDSHHKIGLVGSNYTIIDEEDTELVATDIFTHPDDLSVAEIVSNQFGHGSVVMRSSIVRKAKGYNAAVGHVEDYDLFVRMSRLSKIANLPEALYRWRRNPVGISLSNDTLQQEQAFAVRDRYFKKYLLNATNKSLFNSWHPMSLRSGPRAYCEKKSRLYRDLAYLFWKFGHKDRARSAIRKALLVAPWKKQIIKDFALSTLHIDMSERLTYEYL